MPVPSWNGLVCMCTAQHTFLSRTDTDEGHHLRELSCLYVLIMVCTLQYERPVDMRPQYFLGDAQPQPTEQQSSAQKAAAKSVSNDNAGASMGAVDGLKDVVISTRMTTIGASCKLPVVYKCARQILRLCQSLHCRLLSPVRES